MSDSRIGLGFQPGGKFDRTPEQTPPVKTVSHQPPAQSNEYIVKRGDTLTEIAVKTGQNLQQLLQRNQQIKNPNKIQIGQHINIGKSANIYTVKSGDTLSEVAKAKHTTVGEIMRANPGEIGNRNLIYPSQKLIIPTGVNQTAPTERKTPPTDKSKQPVSHKPIGTTPPQVENKSKIEQLEAANSGNLTKNQSISASGWKVAKVGINDFFNRRQGSTVLAAVIIGHAEGNIDVYGKPRKDYFGHTDPGDKLWNIGSFSRANARFPKSPPARSPQEADQMHLKTLQSDAGKFTNALREARLDSENVWLQSTYFDALNQAGGNIADKMLESKQLEYVKKNGVTPETMKEWRMQGFVNRETGQRWIRQSGRLKGVQFGSSFKTEAALSHDQQRRADAVAEILKNINLIQRSESNNQTKATPGQKMPDTQSNASQPKTSTSNNNELTRSEIKIPFVELKAENNIRLSPVLVGKLKNIATEYKQATGQTLTITDGNRTPLEQSYMMIRQIRKGKLGIYRRKDAAQEVKKAYDSATAQGKSDKQIALDISVVIKSQTERNVYISPHLTNRGADVRFWDMTKAGKAKFIQIVNKYGGEVVTENDHFHLQFK